MRSKKKRNLFVVPRIVLLRGFHSEDPFLASSALLPCSIYVTRVTSISVPSTARTPWYWLWRHSSPYWQTLRSSTYGWICQYRWMFLIERPSPLQIRVSVRSPGVYYVWFLATQFITRNARVVSVLYHKTARVQLMQWWLVWKTGEAHYLSKQFPSSKFQLKAKLLSKLISG